MADIEKISVGGTSYDVRDALAAHALSDIAVAGDNVTFTNTYQNNITLIGSPAVNGTVISNLSSSDYATGNYTFTNSGPFAWKITSKFTTGNSVSGIQRVFFIKDLCCMHLDSSCLTFEVWNTGISPSYYRSISVSSNTTYLMSIEFDGTNTYTYKYSTNNGQSWAEAITPLTGTFSTQFDSSNTAIYIGNDGNNPNYFRGSIDLAYIYLEINGAEVWRGATQTGLSAINATGSSITVDQTYNSASANAQSGVAINGAGFLTKNVDRVAIGQSSSAVSQSVAIGYEATASGTQGVAIGGYGASAARQCIAIGNYVSAGTKYNALAIGFGANSSSKTQATGSGSIAIGRACISTASNTIAIGDTARAQNDKAIAIGPTAFAQNVYAIQLGKGTNSTANTFSVGLSNSLNVRLLNSDGTIPGERMALQGTEAPTTATVGSVGQFYVDTTNQIGYMCVSTADSAYVWKQITA